NSVRRIVYWPGPSTSVPPPTSRSSAALMATSSSPLMSAAPLARTVTVSAGTVTCGTGVCADGLGSCDRNARAASATTSVKRGAGSMDDPSLLRSAAIRLRWSAGYLDPPRSRTTPHANPEAVPWNSLLQSDLKPADATALLINLGLLLILGQIVVWHYQRFSPVLSNKRKFSRVFVFVAATTMLVITIIQHSVALSLGLVGALSVIPFRTPMKEPEELAYLFLSIAIGLGLGANQRVVTIVAVAVVLGYLALISAGRSGALPPRLLVHLSGKIRPEG